MNEDWQSYAAIAVVVLTAIVFAFRIAGRRKSGCGGGCGCTPPGPRVRSSSAGIGKKPPDF
jgi:hypothetical protein